MRILIETSGGGAVVLVVVAALLADGHGGGTGAVLLAALIALVLIVVLGAAVLAAYLVHRARRPVAQNVLHPAVASRPVRGEMQHAVATPAIEAPREIRLEPGQLAELAEILRRQAQQQ